LRQDRVSSIPLRSRESQQLRVRNTPHDRTEERRREDPKPPSSGGSSLQVAWTPRHTKTRTASCCEFLSKSAIPAVARRPLRSQKPHSLQFSLSLDAISRLQVQRLIRLPRPVRAKRLPIDYAALRQTFARMLAESPFRSQTEHARHLGVTRVWVSRVLKSPIFSLSLEDPCKRNGVERVAFQKPSP